MGRELKARKAEWGAERDSAHLSDGRTARRLRSSIQALWDGASAGARIRQAPHPAYPLPWIRERQLWGQPDGAENSATPRVDVEAG